MMLTWTYTTLDNLPPVLASRGSIFDHIEGLQPVDPAALAEYEREMEEVVIPQIVAAVQRREVLAHEARQRGPLFGPGECGGQSCTEADEERLAEAFRGDAGKTFGIVCDGRENVRGQRVIRRAESLS